MSDMVVKDGLLSAKLVKPCLPVT